MGLAAVLVPLLAHLWLQYRSLAELESTMPVARRAMMRNYLGMVTKEVTTLYRTKAGEVLDIPPKGFEPGRTSEIVAHFEKRPFQGAKRLFIGTASETSDASYAVILFYDPTSRSLIRDPGSPEWGAAHAAAANWIAMIMTDTVPETTRMTVDERDPRNRIIVKPIVNPASRVVGVAGMIVDEAIFKEKYLPEAIRAPLKKYFPYNSDEVIVTMLDSNERVIFWNQRFEGMAYEVGGIFPFIFTDYYLGARMRTMTEDQSARRYFLINLSISFVTALVLIGAIFYALRTASRAIKLSQMKSDFVSNVSHELRTPLASIRVFGEFLKLGRVSEEQKIREYGEYIETESRRLTQLINNILDFSKIESGQKTYQFESADVTRIVEATLKTFEVRLEQTGFRIDFTPSPEPLPCAIIDPEAIAQALLNLLDNAVKYSGHSKQISVRIAQRGDFIAVSVVDRGIGIAGEDREKVFEKFYRVSTGLVHDVKGSGLGLSIVKHIIDAHKGRVTVDGTPEGGTDFTFFLPIDQLAPAVAPQIRSSVQGPAAPRVELS
jgi:signal transduction histidine kinase